MRDFTHDMYARLCAAVLAAGYVPLTVRQYLTGAERPPRVVMMRHDIDRWPRRALAMAEIESAYGIAATYYVRMTRHAFKPAIVKELATLGHEIGYHYETLSRERGNVTCALATMARELAMLRAVARVDTAAMHGSPFSPYDNRDIWRHAVLADYDLRGEVYLSLDYSQIGYYTDTGRSWSADATNRRDRPPGPALHPYCVESSEALIRMISEGRYDTLCIQSHPERWSGTLGELCISMVMDGVVNVAKRMLSASVQRRANL